MTRRYLGIAPVTLVAIVSLTPTPAAGQQHTDGSSSSTHTTREWTPPRTADGQPDIQGLWSRRVVGMATYTLEGGNNEEHLLLSAGCAQGIVGCERSPEEINAQLAQRRGQHVSIIVDPADRKVPYQPWAAARRQDVTVNHTNPRGLGDIDPMARCFPVGVPRANYQENTAIQIHQLSGKVVITYEFNHSHRVIPLDGRPHIGEGIKLWMGDSRGRWEGNTLVVDVTNLNDKTWFDVVGTFHSNAMHVVDRWTFVDADTIHYEAAIDDPKVFARPWKVAFAFQRNKQADLEHLEHSCNEGNRTVGLMLGK